MGEGGIRGTVVACRTAGEQVERSILHQGYHNKIHLIRPGCPWPRVALQVQNRDLKHPFISVVIYIYIYIYIYTHTGLVVYVVSYFLFTVTVFPLFIIFMYNDLLFAMIYPQIYNSPHIFCIHSLLIVLVLYLVRFVHIQY